MLANFAQENAQSLIYSLILLAFLVTSLILRRDIKLITALKYLAIWGVIAIIGVAFYAYRFEFGDFTHRMKGAINPESARLDKQGRIVLNLSSDGHFFINLQVNDQPMRFMIDTGASDIVISMKDAQKIGVNTKNLNFNKRYQTANGMVLGASITLRKIEIAGVIFNNVPASINSFDLGTPLLGMSFLRQFHRYEFHKDQLILEF